MESPLPQQKIILIIDDEVQLLDIVKTVLEGEGYRVLTTANPFEGVELYRQHWQSIALVVSDFRMPEMTGGEVLERLKSINPNVAMLLVTGSHDFVVKALFDRGLAGLLWKPFRLDELVMRVKEFVDNSAR